MDTTDADIPVVDNELDVLSALVPLDGKDIVELGCGAAELARALLRRHPESRVTGTEAPVHFADFADSERRTIRATFADRQVDTAQLENLHAAFEAHADSDGATFRRPMHVRLLRRAG